MRHGKWLTAGILLLGVFAVGLAVMRGLTQSFDTDLALRLSLQQGQSSQALIAVMQAMSWIGGGPQRTVIVIVIALAVWRWHSLAMGLAIALSSLVSSRVSDWLKLEFARARPQLVLHLDDVAGSLSYPSGHATSAAVVYLLLALILPPRHRTAGLVLAAVLTGLTGLSRIMLGVHYPSDVLGGWMLGAAFALIGFECAQRRAPVRP